MSGRKAPTPRRMDLRKPPPPAAPPRRVRTVSEEEFLAAGLERYGRRFLEMMRDIPARPTRQSPLAPPWKPEPTGSACAAAGRQLAGYLEAERIAARVEVALGAVAPPLPGPAVSSATATRMLVRTIMQFQPSRSEPLWPRR